MMRKGLINQIIINELRTIYWTEKYFLKVLPILHKSACTRYLKACFKGHLNATQEHVKKLNRVFELIGVNARGKKCSMMSSVVIQTMSVIHTTQKNTLSRDIGLIDAAAQMEGYEINKYTQLIHVFKDLKEFDVVDLLEEILYEEKEAEETFFAVKDDTLNDEIFKPKIEEFEFDELEIAEE